MILQAVMAFTLAFAPPQSSPSNCSAAQSFVGTVCVPADSGKHPAILLLGGSEGGDMMSYAAPRFAQHGFVSTLR